MLRLLGVSSFVIMMLGGKLKPPGTVVDGFGGWGEMCMTGCFGRPVLRNSPSELKIFLQLCAFCPFQVRGGPLPILHIPSAPGYSSCSAWSSVNSPSLGLKKSGFLQQIQKRCSILYWHLFSHYGHSPGVLLATSDPSFSLWCLSPPSSGGAGGRQGLAAPALPRCENWGPARGTSRSQA